MERWEMGRPMVAQGWVGGGRASILNLVRALPYPWVTQWSYVCPYFQRKFSTCPQASAHQVATYKTSIPIHTVSSKQMFIPWDYHSLGMFFNASMDRLMASLIKKAIILRSNISTCIIKTYAVLLLSYLKKKSMFILSSIWQTQKPNCFLKYQDVANLMWHIQVKSDLEENMRIK